MDDETVTRLRRVIIKLARQLNASSTGEGLTPSQASALGLIVGTGPIGLGELAAVEGLNPTMLSRVIARLQSMDLIERLQDPADLRSVSVSATDTGRRVDKQIKASRAAVVVECMKGLGAEHAELILSALPALEEFAEAMRSTRVGPRPW
jgi:DNA-binding MarR family transcriptional regulator